MRTLRRQNSLLFLLLAALLLRAVLPAGTMIGQAGGRSGIVFCTAAGAKVLATDAGTPAAGEHQKCNYCFALALGALPFVPPPSLAPVAAAHQPAFSPARVPAPASGPALPARGPPSLV